MDRKTEQWYNRYFDLFGTDGWKQLMEELEADFVTLNSLGSIQNNDELWFRKGQVEVISGLLNLSDVLERSFQEAQDAEDV